MASGDKVYIADKATLDEVNGKIGSPTDTGGSSTAGTMLAKENAVLTEVGKLGATNDAQSSSTTTGSIFAKLNYLVSQVNSYLSSISTYATRIGTTTDTGGSSAAGTVMAKLNYLASQVSSYLSNINTYVSRIGTTTDAGGTETTGTVMGKLNRIQAKEDEISEKIASSIDIVSAGTNYQSTTFNNFPSTETEILNINGRGVISSIYLYTTNATTYNKVYIDGKLVFDYAVSSTNTTQRYSNIGFNYVGGSLANLTDCVNGKITTDASFGVAANDFLWFNNNLTMVAKSTASNGSNRILIVYGLVG